MKSFLKEILFSYISIILLLNISCVFLGNKVPLKESFVPLPSYSQAFFELKENQKEAYFSFENKFEGKDIIFNFKVGRHFTSSLYLYETYNEIRTDDQGNFIDYLIELELSDNLIFIKSSDITIKKNKYYIVIKDRGNYSTCDYITVFNEQDTLELKHGEPFIINQFFSSNKFMFMFKSEKEEMVTLEFNIDNSDFEEKILISLDGEELYKGIRNKGVIKFNERRNKGGTYLIEVSSLEESYLPVVSSIILYKQKNQVIQLSSGNGIELVYGESKSFSFYVDIEDYELNEENIITFEFSHNVFPQKLLEFCYAKTMNFNNPDDNKFISNMPSHEEESEADFSRLSYSDNIYHLYFKKTKSHEENKRSYLLVHLNFKIDEEIFIYPEKFNVFLSPRQIYFNLSSKEYDIQKGSVKINHKIKINNNMPQVIKIKVPLETKASYIFYTNRKIQTVYDSSMLGNSHRNEILRQIYSISYDTNQQNLIYIKLFGPEENIIFIIESTYSQIYSITEELRPQKTFGGQHLNCGEGFYYIGDYSTLTEETHFFLEEIYGEYKVYARGIIKEDDETILTEENPNYLLNDKIGFLGTSLDIIQLKCSSPGYFNLHLLRSYFTSSINMYSRKIEFLEKGATFFYPKTKINQTNINLEIYTPLGKSLDITCGSDKKTIDSKNKYYQIKYQKAEDVNEYLRIYASEETIVSIRLTDDNLFKVVETEHSYINEDKILIKMKKGEDYKNVNLTFTRIYHNYTYTMFRGDISFATDPLLSGYDYFDINYKVRVNLILSNPYNKPYSMNPDKEDSPFYLMFYVYDPEGIQKEIFMNYTPIEKYEPISESLPKTISIEEKKFSLNIEKQVNKVNIIYQNCGNSLKEINIFSYDDLLYSYSGNTGQKYNLASFPYINLPLQIGGKFQNDTENQYTGAEIGFSTYNISQSDIDEFNKMENNVTQNGKKLQWEKLDNVGHYEIYVFNKDNENIKYLHNPCYLNYIKERYQSLNDNKTYIKYYSTKTNSYDLEKKGNYTVIVAASLEGKIPMLYIYNELNFDSDSSTEDNLNELILWIIIICLAVIIIIVIIVVIISKNKHNDINSNLPEENIKLVRDTTTTISEKQ